MSTLSRTGCDPTRQIAPAPSTPSFSVIEPPLIDGVDSENVAKAPPKPVAVLPVKSEPEMASGAFDPIAPPLPSAALSAKSEPVTDSEPPAPIAPPAPPTDLFSSNVDCSTTTRARSEAIAPPTSATFVRNVPRQIRSTVSCDGIPTNTAPPSLPAELPSNVDWVSS